MTFSTLPAPAASLQTQTFRLNPGWNSIWLEVTPETNNVSVAFRNVPIESVWSFGNRLSTVDFIQNPDEPIWNRSAWLLHVPTNKVESFQNSLFALRAGRAYLVKLEGTTPVTWQISGRPSTQRNAWAPDAYTLRGFPVSSTNAPSFATFFTNSPAHYDPATRRLHSVYRLNATGQWTLTDADDRIGPGEAYWVLTRGASDYPGPFAIGSIVGDQIEFRNSSDGESVRIENRTSAPRELRIIETGRPELNPISIGQFDRTQGRVWTPLFRTNSNEFRITLGPLESCTVNLAARRSNIAQGGFSSTLIVTDNLGIRYSVPVTVPAPGERPAGLQGVGSSGGIVRKSALPTPATALDPRLVGLWFGSATVTNVSEAHSGVLVTNTAKEVTRSRISRLATPTASEFVLRLIVHVDTNGTARLLKEVIQMRTQPEYGNDANGRQVLVDAGRAVLVTDERKISTFAGAATRAGATVGRRLSSVHFDFPGAPDRNYVDFSGAFGMGRTVSARVVVDSDFPTNPFKHKYHPDHDNLTADYRQPQGEAFLVDRTVRLTPAAAPLNGKTDPSYGASVLEGQYEETVVGLHQQPIEASGSFTLRRISDVGVLNQ